MGKKRNLPEDARCLYGSFSDSSTVIFKKYPNPVFTVEGFDFPTEDPHIWSQGDKLYAIIKDIRVTFTKSVQALALFESIV